MWIVFALGAVVGLVLGNKTLRDKLGQLLRSYTSKKKTADAPAVRVKSIADRIIACYDNGGAYSIEELMQRTGLSRQAVETELTRRTDLFMRVGKNYWKSAVID